MFQGLEMEVSIGIDPTLIANKQKGKRIDFELHAVHGSIRIDHHLELIRTPKRKCMQVALEGSVPRF